MPSLQNMTDVGYPPLSIRQFLGVFFPVALLLGLLTAALQYHSHALTYGNLQASQTHDIDIAADVFSRDFDAIFVDLSLLATNQEIRRFATQAALADFQPAAKALNEFHNHKPRYGTVSFIDPDGQQLLTTTSSPPDGSVKAIEQALLRHLSIHSKERPVDNFAISPLTLLTDEQGLPQPTLYAAIAIRDANERNLGALVISYTASQLSINRNKPIELQADAKLLINRDSNWLQHLNRDHDDGWAPTTPGETFEQAYPDAWRHMQAADSGQFKTSHGLFTFATLASTGGADGNAQNSQPMPWIIASLITAETLNGIAMHAFWGGMLIYSLLLLPAALGCFYVARMIHIRMYNQRRIRALSAAVEQSHDMVLITDAAGRIRYVNPRFEEITGYSRAEITGQSPNLLKSGKHDKAFYRRLWQTIKRGEPFEATISNRKKDGELFHNQTTISPLSDKSGIIGYVASSKDITTQVNTQERLLRLAFHHPLTGLPNRSLFRDHLHDAAARARRGHHQVAVLFIDLDRFKQVNDSLGHQVGDALLMAVAQRLREAVREIDMVAHLGGDEFTILLDAIEHPNQVQAVTAKLLQLFEQPFLVQDRELYIGASIGIALFPTDSDNVESLVEQADTAMYQAKRAGRGHFQFYSAEMTTLANERLELESQLRTALHKQEFKLLFQPIVDPLRREMRGLEALLRWHHPDGSIRTPDDFIPVLEETGMIVPITAWVLGEACRQYRHLHDVGMGRIRINVNISARSFYQGDLVKLVRQTLEQNRMPPAQLVLEVTESLLLEDQHHVQNALEQLRQLGISIAIDDFGTGYSSLAYLRRLPISIIKIDRTFIHGVSANSRDAALVSAMMAMAQELQMDVVAEGVEHAFQLDFLRQRHCRGAQGFLFSPPIPANHINTWLDQDPRWPWKKWMNQGVADRLH